jgi:hypothetical protein
LEQVLQKETEESKRLFEGRRMLPFLDKLDRKAGYTETD